MNAKLPDTPREAWVDPDDAPELTDEDFARGVWMIGDQVVSKEEAQAAIKEKLRPGRPLTNGVSKSTVTIRLDDDVLAQLRATGKGWQTRLNEHLREWVGR